MRQDHGGGPAFFIFTKCYHICNQSIIGYRNRPAKRINPPVRGFKLFEFIRTAILEKILLAASSKVKGVHGHPSWVLQSPYDLKARPIII
jgi:hypothetical protein